MLYPLSHLPLGHTAQISWVSDNKSIYKRLSDLGFTPGTFVSCVLKRRRGLAAYLVRGAVIALRREDADLILVEEKEEYSEV